MSNEFQTANTVEVRSPETVETDKGRIDGFCILRQEQVIFLGISFGTGSPMQVMKRERWMVTGDFYNQLMSGTPDGETFDDLLINGSVSLIHLVQGTEGMRDNLIASGQLVVSEGGLVDVISIVIVTGKQSH